MKDGKLDEYYEGEDPVALPHEVQALPGNKFTPRILKRERHVLRRRARQSSRIQASNAASTIRRRTRSRSRRFAPALDYILAAGDSWHANTPRRGGVLDRVSSVHQETSLCVACHATHFSAARAAVCDAQRLSGRAAAAIAVSDRAVL